MPQLKSYGGFTDPLNHSEGYKVYLMIQGANNALHYIGFPTTLKKAAQV